MPSIRRASLKIGGPFGRRAAAMLGLLMICVGVAQAQDPGEREHAVVLEVGGAGEQPVTGGAANFGGTSPGTANRPWASASAC